MGELTEAVLCTPRPHDYEDCPSKGSPALEKTHSQENLVGKNSFHTGPETQSFPSTYGINRTDAQAARYRAGGHVWLIPALGQLTVSAKDFSAWTPAKDENKPPLFLPLLRISDRQTQEINV